MLRCQLPFASRSQVPGLAKPSCLLITHRAQLPRGIAPSIGAAFAPSRAAGPKVVFGRGSPRPLSQTCATARPQISPTPPEPQPQGASKLAQVLSVVGCVTALCCLLWFGSGFSAMANAATPPPLASISATDWLGERFIWLVTKVSNLHVVLKVVLVLSSTLPAVLLFGTMYATITGNEIQPSLIKMYALLNRLPGAQVLNEKTAPAAILVNTVFYIGLFVFAVMLGVVTDEIKTTFKNIREGKYHLNQAGHVVILNWNSQCTSLLRQISAARKAGLFKQPVAILAQKSKADMDRDISRIKDLSVEVYTRNGNPTVPGDLAAVAAAQAASIIVMNPYRDVLPSSNALLGVPPAQTAVALATVSPSLASQHVVFQSPQHSSMAAEHVEAFKRITKLGSHVQIMQFAEDDLITRLVTLSAVQPGIQQVVAKVLSPGDVSLRLQAPAPELIGGTFQTARRMFADGVLCGVMRGEHVDLMVPDTQRIQETDKLVILSPTPDVPLEPRAVPVFTEAAKRVPARIAGNRQYKSRPRNIIIVCLDPEEVPRLTEMFGDMTPKGSYVTFLLNNIPSGLPSRVGNCNFRYLQVKTAHLSTLSALKEAGIETATSVVITGLSKFSTADADGLITAALLQIQDCVKQVGRVEAPHVVAQINKASTQTSITSYLKLLSQEAHTAGTGSAQIIQNPDLFLADDFVTTMLVQAAAQPLYSKVTQQLLCSEGAEIYLRNPAAFNLAYGDLLTFADVAETTKACGEIAIGIMHKTSTGHNLVLAPEPTYPMNLQENDRLIVLAEHFDANNIKAA